MQLHQLCRFCDDYLSSSDFDDYCPNGLQVEGKAEVKRLVSGVTASRALIEAAIEHEADALLVHHGYFWKGESAPITGVKGQRIRLLMQHDISLLAYHLPLDAHPEVGNNACLAARCGWSVLDQQGLVWRGTLPQPLSLQQLLEQLEQQLQTRPLGIAGGDGDIRSIAWCSGAAHSYIEQAASMGVDAFISGEIAEPTVHLARELGIHYIAAGHHATERYGVQALGELLQGQFEIDHQYIDIANPV